jgi:hypothetical protein
MKPSRHLIAELQATADALRQIRTKLAQLFSVDRPGQGMREMSIVLIDGLNVATSLETLARLMAAEQGSCGDSWSSKP